MIRASRAFCSNHGSIEPWDGTRAPPSPSANQAVWRGPHDARLLSRRVQARGRATTMCKPSKFPTSSLSWTRRVSEVRAVWVRSPPSGQPH